VYREWCTDSSPLMNAALKNGQVLQAHTSPAAPLEGECHGIDDCHNHRDRLLLRLTTCMACEV
jgi:hypothetical protein